MSTLRKTFYTFTLAGCFSSLGALANDGGLSRLPVARDGLPVTRDVEEFFEVTDNIDLSSSDFSYKDGSGGGSINLEYKGRGILGDFLSRHADGIGDNAAGNPEGQILAYNLSRILGYSQVYGRGRWHTISGRPIAALRQFAKNNSSKASYIKKSKNRLLKTTLQKTITGTINLYGPQPYNLKGLESGNSFVTRSTLGSLIRADKSRPRNREIEMGKFTLNDLEAAQTLSTMFLIDALTSQWDRFSGGNFNVVKDGSIYRLVAYDNGGAGISGWGSAFVGRYLSWTTRFDRDATHRIIFMNRFLKGKEKEFLHFTKQAELIQALGIRTFEKDFRKNLEKVAAHLESTLERHGNAAYF